MLYLYRRKIFERLTQLFSQYSHQIEHAILFGSTIVDAHRPDSDIDLLVVANPTIKSIIEKELDLIYCETTIPVAMIFHTPMSFNKSKKDPLIETIFKEGLRIV